MSGIVYTTSRQQSITSGPLPGCTAPGLHRRVADQPPANQDTRAT